MFRWLLNLFRPQSKGARPGVLETPATAVSTASSAAAPPATPPPIPRVTKLKLDAGDFLPITREEILETGRQQGRGWFSNVWFGRRDLIPPQDDPRTKMVDRGLVTNGLLTPEQLVEIHTIGAERER